MTDYTKATNFAVKDGLPTGNPSKIVKGTEIDTEFNALQTAIATKADEISPSLSGTIAIAASATISTNGASVSDVELSYLDGVTSGIQAQLNAKQASDATLTSIAALGTAADKLAYTTGVDTWAETALTAAARTVLDDATVADMRTTLGAAASGANSDITSVGAITGVTATAGDNTTKLATTAFVTTAAGNPLTSGTVIATTSGTSHDFTIPSWVSRITVSLIGVSSTLASDFRVQLGTSGGVVTTGYELRIVTLTTTPTVVVTTDTNGICGYSTSVAGADGSGTFTLVKHTGNTWNGQGLIYRITDGREVIPHGWIALADVLTTVRLTCLSGTFDAGSVNILYE